MRAPRGRRPGRARDSGPFVGLAGFEVAVASTGIAAVELARSRTVAACVCDLRMLDVSGLEVRKAIDTLGAPGRSGLRLSEHDVSRAVGLSESHLGRLLVKHTRAGFRALRRTWRMRRAAELLAESVEHIGEIGYRVGYDDETQFSREFREFFGLCPRRFRELCRSRTDGVSRF